VRRWRKLLIRPRGGRKVEAHILLPLIPNLLVGLLLIPI
jgi:hypothetical protein